MYYARTLPVKIIINYLKDGHVSCMFIFVNLFNLWITETESKLIFKDKFITP